MAVKHAVGIFSARREYIKRMEQSVREVTSVKTQQSHSFSVVDRKKGSLTGVLKVDGSSDTELALTTALGRLVVIGSGLKITKFDEADGNLCFVGNIDCIKYTQAKQPLLKRIFK